MEGGTHTGVGHRRRLAALALSAALLPITTVTLHPDGPIVSLQTVLLVYLLIAVIVALVGGAVAGMAAAVAGFLLANWFFTSPFQTWTVDDPENVVGLIVFLVVGTSVGWLVGYARQRAVDATRARTQVEALAAATTVHEPDDAFQGLVDRVAEVFSADGVALHEENAGGWIVRAHTGANPAPDPGASQDSVTIDDRRTLTLEGVRLTSEDRRVLAAFAAQAAAAFERELLRSEAAHVATMAETDRLRTALLSAVSHDLRTPLASIKASVTSLLETGIDWPPEQANDFLMMIHEETERLNRIVGQLLDASRIQVGAVQVVRRPISPEELVSLAVASLSATGERLEIDVDETLPPVDTDPGLCERALANLIDNALAHSPGECPVLVRATRADGHIAFEVIDRGPGIPSHLTTRALQPFHRLDDTRTSTGVGLGLAVTKGFLETLGHELILTANPEGGTIARVCVPIAGQP
jgi:two-component system sensor histidine kinase KdpD